MDKTDDFANLESDLSALNQPNIVITGLDLQEANQAFGLSYLQISPPGGFVFSRQLVAPANVQAVATQLAQQGQVITALSFDGGQVYLLSYGWQSNADTYDAKVVTATGDTLISQASMLASEGYIITALGGDANDGLLLVGTRVAGDA